MTICVVYMSLVFCCQIIPSYVDPYSLAICKRPLPVDNRPLVCCDGCKDHRSGVGWAHAAPSGMIDDLAGRAWHDMGVQKNREPQTYSRHFKPRGHVAGAHQMRYKFRDVWWQMGVQHLWRPDCLEGIVCCMFIRSFVWTTLALFSAHIRMTCNYDRR
jgi:hypothetical protein